MLRLQLSGFAIYPIGLRKEAQGVLFVRAQDLLTFIDYLHLETADEIGEKQINKAADRWAKRQPQPPNLINFRYGEAALHFSCKAEDRLPDRKSTRLNSSHRT